MSRTAQLSLVCLRSIYIDVSAWGLELVIKSGVTRHMQIVHAQSTPGRIRTRLTGIAMAGLAMLTMQLDAVAAGANAPRGRTQNRGNASPTTGVVQPPDFFNVMDRTEGTAHETPATPDTELSVVCLAGCGTYAAVGPVVVSRQSFEIATSASLARETLNLSVRENRLSVAITEAVDCLAGCSTPTMSHGPRSIQVEPHRTLARAMPLPKPTRHAATRAPKRHGHSQSHGRPLHWAAHAKGMRRS
jgi:hypothetical protein